MTSIIDNTIDEGGEATIDIVIDGDIVFVVSPSCRRLRVHSLFVKTASPVFNAMLGSNFKEGRQLRQPDLTEIALPEDNAQAMEIVLNVIHGRNNKVPETLEPDELLQVAIASDKYDCFTPLAFATKIWLSCKSSTDAVGMWTLAMAALVFRRREIFAEITSALVLDYAGSYVDLTKKYGPLLDPTLQLRAAAMLEEARNKLRMSLIMNVLSGDWHCTASGKKSRHRSDWLAQFMRQTGKLGQTAISTTLEALDKYSSPSANDDCDGFGSTNQLGRIFKSISDECRMQHKNDGGLCLLCVRTGEPHGSHS